MPVYRDTSRSGHYLEDETIEKGQNERTSLIASQRASRQSTEIEFREGGNAIIPRISTLLHFVEVPSLDYILFFDRTITVAGDRENDALLAIAL